MCPSRQQHQQKQRQRGITNKPPLKASSGSYTHSPPCFFPLRSYHTCSGAPQSHRQSTKTCCGHDNRLLHHRVHNSVGTCAHEWGTASNRFYTHCPSCLCASLSIQFPPSLTTDTYIHIHIHTYIHIQTDRQTYIPGSATVKQHGHPHVAGMAAVCPTRALESCREI